MSREYTVGKGEVKLVAEYKRTCKECKKVWHSLVSREDEIQKRMSNNAAQGAAGFCSPNTTATSVGTAQIIESELQRVRQCPECSSSNYKESIVQHEEPSIGANSKTSKAASSGEISEEAQSPSIPQPKKGIGCLGISAIVVGAIIVIWIVTAIVGAVQEGNSSSSSNSSSGSSVVVPRDTVRDTSLPAGWNANEINIWTLLSATYPVISGIDLAGKQALMDNAYLTCQAYSEGYSRLEILNVSDSPSLPAGLADDLMTLAVTTFCPEYTNQQLQ